MKNELRFLLFRKFSYINQTFFRCYRKNQAIFCWLNSSRRNEINSRGFHFSMQLNVKSFQEKENEYAHGIMEKYSAYASSIAKQPRATGVRVSPDSPKEITEFAKVTIQSESQNISLEDKQFSVLISDVVRIVPKLSNENLLNCLLLLCCWPPTHKTWTPNFKTLWNNLDYECVKRLGTWKTHLKLLVADYWFHLRLNRISQYNKNMINSTLQNFNELSDTEIVQLMFYINLQRDVTFRSMSKLEARILPVIEAISVEELGIICLGFFKTKNKISDISIIKAVINKFLNEIEGADSVVVVALLKFLKKSMHLSYTELYIPLLHKCVSLVNKWDIKTCVHASLLASECHVYHPLLLNAILDKVTLEIEDARLKDCMKLLQCLAHFNHMPNESFNDLLFLEIHKDSRKPEITDIPRNLVYFALYYAYMGHFNYDFLNMILDPDFVKRCTTLFPDTCMTFAEIDVCVEIECKDYKGHRLDKGSWNILHKRRGNIVLDVENPNTLTRLTNETIHSLEALLGDNGSIMLKHILPHMFSPDIVVKLSSNPQSHSDLPGHLPSPPKNDTWICFVLGIPFSFAYRSKHLTGVTTMKLRQLERMGYQVIFIPYFELPRDSTLRKNFLKQKLKDVNSCCNSKFTITLQ